MKKYWKWATLFPGICIEIIGHIFDAKDVIALNISPTWWQMIGFLLFAISVIFILYMNEQESTHQKTIKAENSTLQTTKSSSVASEWVDKNRPSENHEWDNDLQRYVLKGDPEEIQAINDEVWKLSCMLADFHREDEQRIHPYTPKTTEEVILRSREKIDDIHKKMSRWLQHAGIKRFPNLTRSGSKQM